MKKSNLITVSAAVLLLSLQSAAAQVCTTPPTCDALGYTKSEADCSGKTILKCPLDQTKVYCPSADEISSSKTYKVGDIYYDEKGVGVGTVVKVDSTGKHGIVVIAGGSGNAETATTTCASRTAGGLNWSLANPTNACKLDKGASCCGCYLRTSSGNGYCSTSWSVYTSDCQSADKVLGFYCEAPF